jgi:hypothetical protein
LPRCVDGLFPVADVRFYEASLPDSSLDSGFHAAERKDDSKGCFLLSPAKRRETRDGQTCNSSLSSPTSNVNDPGPSPDSFELTSTLADDGFFALLALRVVGIVNRAVSRGPEQP